VPVTALKSYFGNLGAGTGLVELAATMAALEHQQVPPTLNFDQPDPECPVNIVTELTPAANKHALALNLSRTGQAVAVVLEEGVPVSLCYPALVTESFWDVTIETVEGYRRGGRAVAAFLRLESEMRDSGLEPVWGALESNAASLALAAKLGFERVGAIRVFGSCHPFATRDS